MRTVRVLSLLGLLILLSACSVTVAPSDFDLHGVVGAGGSTIVDSRLGLRAYPGSTVIDQRERGERSTTTFETGANLESVFDHFDGQLARQGWRRSDLEMRPNRAEARYRNGGDELELELVREGNSGRYRLSIELDD
ncbi:MAG TPA: hypothetical protein VF168_03495 [Trueperaceae bacterium]